MLAEVGLTEAVAQLPKQERTMLRRGGEPLTREQIAQVQLARAWYDSPSLVILDRIDAALSDAGRERLAAGIGNDDEVTILISDRADELTPNHRVWKLDADPATPAVPRPHLTKEKIS